MIKRFLNPKLWRAIFKLPPVGDAATKTTTTTSSAHHRAPSAHDQTLDSLIKSSESLLEKSKRFTELGKVHMTAIDDNERATEEIKRSAEKYMKETVMRSLKQVEEKFANVELDKDMNIVMRTSDGNGGVLDDDPNTKHIYEKIDLLLKMAKDYMIESATLDRGKLVAIERDYKLKVKELVKDIETNTAMSKEVRANFLRIVDGLEDLGSDSIAKSS
ncbi:hypothetical protein SAMD00019534_017230 [Acytostelium subglobosum LB1]|uniref:hypothetical protein n=1 Tax=Acytostelium subglobosum LB1 TaxID=1410327 RepID=UPI0006451437|nr:hypothetical protein SAMD00019534_017230 [Acytostelium subglobosum LB1]GAM18548.1 hypothetical protein SAMD00019534_017230 [Acytostelium subglobosum LB1]|eukprot:XP_012757768.1 hypothetical protein SAMD00019534_017230 [Acytostelium subglobosum LB1]